MNYLSLECSSSKTEKLFEQLFKILHKKERSQCIKLFYHYNLTTTKNSSITVKYDSKIFKYSNINITNFRYKENGNGTKSPPLSNNNIPSTPNKDSNPQEAFKTAEEKQPEQPLQSSQQSESQSQPF